MGDIYCLYASENGIPCYVGMTEGKAEKRWKKHITAALDLAPGQLYDWIRDVMRRGGYVGLHVLQSEIVPSDLTFYEEYWISQFPGLFNVLAKGARPDEPTEVAHQVIVAIKAKLVRQSATDAS